MFNLLSNAFKYTPDGKNIDLILEFKEKNLLIKVKDEGNGIELHKIDMLFKRFETLGQTDANLSSGIGLSLVKEWVDMLHGTITVDSMEVLSLFPCREEMRFLSPIKMSSSF